MTDPISLEFRMDRLRAVIVELWKAEDIDLHMCDGTTAKNKFGLLRDIREDATALLSALSRPIDNAGEAQGSGHAHAVEVAEKVRNQYLMVRMAEGVDTVETPNEAMSAAISAYFSALASPTSAAPAQWNPIETAPKTGEEFIARTGPEWSAFSCFWDGEAFVHLDKDDGYISYGPKEWLPMPAAGSALSYSPVALVGVKPLEWVKSWGPDEDGDESHTASTPFGNYTVERLDGRWKWRYCFDEYHDEDNFGCDGEAEGKACAQAHWADRLSPALTPAEKAGVGDGDDWRDVMSGIASYLGAGLGSDDATAEDLGKRIRWGIDDHVNAAIKMCADVVELVSQQKPYATWGEVKSAILDLSRSLSTTKPAQGDGE